MSKFHQSVSNESLVASLSSLLEKRINLKQVETWSQNFWRQKPLEGKPAAAMLFPPPNVTGNLHLGHALTGAVQDTYVRQQNMKSNRIVWLPGFDHAGIGTQLIIEKLLWDESKVRRKDIGREKFLEKTNEWKAKKREEMINQLQRLGLCLDFTNEFFTLDNKRSFAVKESFKLLFNRGLIKRKHRVVHWSKMLETTISDIEVESRILDDGSSVDVCGRTGETVDKVNLNQWFLETEAVAHKAVDLVRNKSIKLTPETYTNTWSSWLIDNGVKEWCLSRQSWWGHTIPAYRFANSSDLQENWVAADNEDQAADLLEQKFPYLSGQQVLQDGDMLDTWFSSALLPLSVLGWPNEIEFGEAKKDNLYPLELLETGFDILNFWVSKMVMMSLLLVGEIPFKNVALHGMICDSFGKKMSKSKGNVIDPLDIMDGMSLKHMSVELRKMFPNGLSESGSDGLRAYLLSNNLQDQVIAIKPNQLDQYRRLSNKLWNIYRYILSNIEADAGLAETFLNETISLKNEVDETLVNDLIDCIAINNNSAKDYRYHQALRLIELFITQSLSKVYMSSISGSCKNQNHLEHQRQFSILVKATLDITKLLHPFMPHVTEFLYQKFSHQALGTKFDKLVSLSNTRYPEEKDWRKLL